jgi:flagellar motor switch protein FliN/FliY
MADKPTSSQDMVDQVLADAQTTVNDAQHDAASAIGDLPSFDEVDPQTRIDLLGDVNLNVTIELGRTEMLVEDVLRLGSGSVVELDKLAGDPVDVYVNNRLIARGEVLVLNDNFCIRISEIVANVEEQADAADTAAVATG